MLSAEKLTCSAGPTGKSNQPEVANKLRGRSYTQGIAFQHSGQYEFRVMPFGLSGAPATFLKAMNTTLYSLLRKCVLVFFYEIRIFSKIAEEHVHHLRLVFELLRRDQWQVKRSKCSFMQRQLRYLGHVISKNGVATDPDKIIAV